MRLKTKVMTIAGALLGALWLSNTSVFLRPEGTPTLMAHRGVHQEYDRTDLGRDDCTATRVFAPINPVMENTIASMRAAFEAGADVVELDLHPTTDGQFAVFHDWTVDCRTDGSGRTRDHTMAELKALDIGYGYTANGGATYPLRGTGVGLMPSLEEVITAFPDRQFFINLKSSNPKDGEAFAALMQARPDLRAIVWDVYGGAAPVKAVKSTFPDLKTTTREGLKSCLTSYVLVGWSGHVPAACCGTRLVLPINIAPYLWGWPDRFMARMERAGSPVVLRGAYKNGSAGGIDTPEDAARIPTGFSGTIWTDDIETIAPLIRAN